MLNIIYLPLCTISLYNSACTSSTAGCFIEPGLSSEKFKLMPSSTSGNGPNGVIASGLILAWLFVYLAKVRLKTIAAYSLFAESVLTYILFDMFKVCCLFKSLDVPV